MAIYLKYFLFTIVMATIPITSQITISTDEDNRTDSDTDSSAEKTEDELHVNTSTWTPANKKKLQHMAEFHPEYQCIFGEGASIQTIMKRRISHMNPPMLKSVCEEEMQSTHLDNNEVIIEYMAHVHSNKIKKLKPTLIKSEPDREYTHHVVSDDDIPAVPEENFTQKREVTIDSYSDPISSNDKESSGDRTVTIDSDSSATPTFEEVPCEWEADSKGIETTLHQIAAGLQSATEGYLALASHMSKVMPYELPQLVTQIPPPPMDVPMPIQKALLVDGESKVVNHLIHGEYELNNTSWSKLQKKYNISRNKIYTILKGKGRPRVSLCRQTKKIIKPKSAASTSHSESVNE